MLDVLQYVAYQIRLTNLHKILHPYELFAVCISALAHDVGHQGLNNAYNINAKTPLGILYKNQSVMETAHCTVLIKILNFSECNVFFSLDVYGLQTVWTWIMRLILATDMGFHFKLIDQANETLDSGGIDLKEENHRLMVMELLIKTADICNVSRPFNIADRWSEVLCEEFWRQGDMEKELEIEYASPNNIRGSGNKAKGQVGFYQFVCVPLYNLIVRLFPELDVIRQSLTSNLEVWKKIVKDEEKTTKETDT